MAAASPTPMGSSHFGSLSRRPSRQAFRPQRPPLHRSDSVLTEAQAQSYSLNDSSDDEMPMMKFSAITNALLNGVVPSIEPSPKKKRSPPRKPFDVSGHYARPASASSVQPSSPSVAHSPPLQPRRIVRISSGSSGMRRQSSLSSAVKRRNERNNEKKGEGAESPLVDLSTPAAGPRTVRIPITSNGKRLSGGSSGSLSNKSNRTNSATQIEEDELDSQEYPTTAGRSHLATSQGSVSRYGTSTLGRSRYGDDVGVQGSMRVKRVGKGMFLSGPARRGRRRMDEEEQSPLDDNADGLNGISSSQEPESQKSQTPGSQESQARAESQETHENLEHLYPPVYRDFASGSPPSSKVDILHSVLRSRSPPRSSALANSQRSATSQSNTSSQPGYPAFKVPEPRPDLPSSNDQENEAPPTFKRNKQAPLIHLDKIEKVPVRPASRELDSLQAGTPLPMGRQPLALKSENTPRRPAPPPPKMSILEAATTTAGAATTSHGAGKRNRLKVNGKIFTRLDCIGRGGSSKVYRVMAENSKFFALKRVQLEEADEASIRGFKGEIDLLKKLEGVDRVIRLYDWELNEEKSVLSVLMEMGELDMNKILELRVKSENSKFDPSFVRHYWKEMLECLEAIHEHDIVHSDLKPHNFVLVQGRLKLIDFGIANAIETDETMNVHRETQIGTPNYMSPESLMDSNAGKTDSRGRISNEPKLMKLGKPSDIWSLGCILYQMVYGRAPFAHIQNTMQRCQAIMNFNYAIEYPTTGVGSVPVPNSLIKTLKKCLNRDQFQRPTATELLRDHDPFLYPVEFDDEKSLPMTEELLGRILLNVQQKCRDRTPSDMELLKIFPAGYFDRMRRNAAEGKPL